MSYIVPVHRPSGVRFAIKLNFLSANEDTIIVAKANRLELYSQSNTDGLTLVHSRTVYGYISILNSFRPASSTTDHLFVGTDRNQYFTCSWDAGARIIKTEQSYVDQADKTLRNAKELNRCHIDPSGRFMTLELYDGVVSVIPFVQPSNKRVKRTSSAGSASNVGTLGEPIQNRIEETLTRDSTFLDIIDSSENPRLAILWEDNQDNPQLRIRVVKQSGSDASQVSLDNGPELMRDLEAGASHLIPVSAPYGGLLVLGERSITYANNELDDVINQPLQDDATIWTCWSKVDDTRWLLADDYGRLSFIMLETENQKVVGWKLDRLGQSARAACIVYLDEGLVFIGSHSGDSQIVRILPGTVEVLQTLANIAPILDFSIMDLGRGSNSSLTSEFSSGQARIVAACGAWQDGTIRGVRSGVGIEELGVFGEIPLISDMWALSSTGQDGVHDVLLTTFYNETRIFTFDAEGDVEEVAEFHNLDLSQSTILAMNLPDRKLLQVHEGGVEICDLESGMSIHQWKPTDVEAKITSAAANGAHLIVVENGVTLHVFHLSGQTVSAPTSKTVPAESQVSGVAIPTSQSNVCIISRPQMATIVVLDLHTLEEKTTQSLGEHGRAVPRSVIVAQVLHEGPPTVFIAMVDGTVITYAFDPTKNIFSSMTRILLGTEPVVLKALPQPSESGHIITNVFASCEQPSMIYSSEGRIIYSAVNTDKSSRVCQFNSETYPGAVALASPTELKLAMIGKQRSTQLQTLPIGQTVRCLAYEAQAKVFGIGCVDRLIESGTEALLSSVKIVDEVSFQGLDSQELKDNELVECILAIPPENDDDTDEPTLFVVGTSMMVEGDGIEAPLERGRIIVYQVDRKQKLKVVTEVSLKGACRSLALCDGHIVAGLVKVVALYNLIPSRERGGRYGHQLERLAACRTASNPLSISVQNSTSDSKATIAVADLMKSLSILTIVSPTESKHNRWELKETCRHFANVWSSATSFLSENEWVLADMDGNLTTLRQNTEAVTDDERRQLEVSGFMRLGEVVNKIVPLNKSGTIPNVASKGKERARKSSSMGGLQAQVELQRGPGSRTGPLIQPQAFLATVEGALYMIGAVNQPYIDALLRLQSALATKVQAPGYMPWDRFRAPKTDVMEKDEPFRFIDGEMVESGLLSLPDSSLQSILDEHGLTDPASDNGLELSVAEVRAWGEELRRLY